jgi:hypothetical protein
MKTKYWFAAIAAIATLGTCSLLADTDTTTTTTTHDRVDHSGYWDNSDVDTFFRPYELQIDAFGMASLGEADINNLTGAKVVHDGRLGVGGGINVFFCKWVGIGGDIWTEDWDRQLASGNLILRIPIPKTVLAPYAFGGAGYKWNGTDEGVTQAGGGLEIRFMKHLGIFVDARYIFTDSTDDFGVGRAGLRLNF